MDTILELNAKDQQILQLLANNFRSVKEIAARLFLSEATVRRRLASLESKNLIIRTHGGAVLNQGQQVYKNIPIYLRTTQFNEEKKAVASKAAKLIGDGNILFVDSSSTALCLLPHLASFKNLTVCTNSLKAAMVLAEMEINCTLLGGDILFGEQACNSQETLEMIQRIYADLFFFSCDALSADGMLTDNAKHSCYLRLAYMKNAKKSVLLLDHTKLDTQCSFSLCHLKDVDFCICDKPLPEALRQTTKTTLFL